MEFADSRAVWLQVFLLCLLHVSSQRGLDAERLPMKVVDEPVMYGPVNSDSAWPVVDGDDHLSLKMKPANFSGPVQFQRLLYRCFEMKDRKYKYIFCPFDNVTQHEVSASWNPYKGVLGVWKEWKIMNNTFVAMVMGEGDTCGQISRTTEVNFVCGKVNQIVNVSEPMKCQYHLNFSTPLVCHEEAMLVYPRLPAQLRHKWDELETVLYYEEITIKGYQKGLRLIFEEAGFQLSAAAKESLMTTLEKQPQKLKSFRNLLQCEQEFASLQKEVQELKKKEEALLLQQCEDGSKIPD